MTGGLKLRATSRGVEIGLKVVPRASHPGLDGLFDGRLKLRLSAAPTDGAANLEALALVAKLLSVPGRDVELVTGATSRQKLVRIRGLTADEVLRRLEGKLSGQGARGSDNERKRQ